MEDIYEYKIINKPINKPNLFLYSVILNISYTIILLKFINFY